MDDIAAEKMICLNFNGLELEMMSAYQNYVTIGKEENAINSYLVSSYPWDS